MPNATRLIGQYEEPKGIANAVGYYNNIANKVDGDTLFAGIKLTVTADAIAAVGTCDTATIDFAAGTITKAALQVFYINMKSKMDLLLAEVQAAADVDEQQALDIFTRNDIAVKDRTKHQWDDIDAMPGTLSGSFNLSMKPMSKDGTYLWMIRVKGTTDWDVADYQYEHTGYCEGYTPGNDYEFYGQTSNVNGKSAKTQIITVKCL